MSLSNQPIRRALAIGSATVVGVIALTLSSAPAADAHVTVAASSTEAGGYSVLTFRVPTESETANTVGLVVHLPAKARFTSVQTEPVAGWSATVTRDEVTWTANGEGLGPDEFGEFRLAVGPLPKSGTLFLPAVQTYSDGEVVRWVQQASGSAEPEYPAPSVVVSAATASASPAATPDGAGGGEAGALGFGVAGIVVALVAAGVAAVALRRTRRHP